MSDKSLNIQHIVPQLEQKKRLQDYLVGVFEQAPTKSAIKKLIKKNLVSVNNKIATTAYFINGGECIQLTIPPNSKPKKKFICELKVLFEDEYLALIHKPPGILVSGNKFKTIANALAQNLIPSTLADACMPQPIHRLDYETTGILLVGKTKESIRALSKLFEAKQIEKSYFAITIGKMPNAEGQIVQTVDDKTAISDYWVVDTVVSKRFEQLNLVQLSPQTGRRHQLRQHLLSIGTPILGDKKYFIENLVLNGKGLYLHAYCLQFSHPFTKQKMCVKDENIKRFEKIFESISKRF